MFGTNNVFEDRRIQTIELKKHAHKGMQLNLDYNKDLLFSKNNNNYDDTISVVIMYFNILASTYINKGSQPLDDGYQRRYSFKREKICCKPFILIFCVNNVIVKTKKKTNVTSVFKNNRGEI